MSNVEWQRATNDSTKQTCFMPNPAIFGAGKPIERGVSGKVAGPPKLLGRPGVADAEEAREGEVAVPHDNGVPTFARLDKVRVDKVLPAYVA